MIVKCIDESCYWTIRFDKEYKVLSQTKDKYVILDEENEEYGYPKELFEVVSSDRNFTLLSFSNEELLEEIKRRMCK